MYRAEVPDFKERTGRHTVMGRNDASTSFVPGAVASPSSESTRAQRAYHAQGAGPRNDPSPAQEGDRWPPRQTDGQRPDSITLTMLCVGQVAFPVQQLYQPDFGHAVGP